MINILQITIKTMHEKMLKTKIKNIYKPYSIQSSTYIKKEKIYYNLCYITIRQF